jgi:hypothetical protein
VKKIFPIVLLAIFLAFLSCRIENTSPVAPVIQAITPASTGPITVTVQPGSTAQAVLSTSGTGTSAITTLTFDFPANMVTQTADVTITAAPESLLPVQLPYPCDSYFMSFVITANPSSLTTFNERVEISAKVSPTIPIGTTLYLGTLRNSSWVIVSTLVVGSGFVAIQNLPSTTLPGIISPGTYILYQEPWDCGGTIKPVSNLGVALVADDSSTLQVIHLYDAKGNVLSKPTMVALAFSGACDIDGTAVTPDGARGIIVDGCTNSARFFNGANIPNQNPIISSATFDLSISGTDGDAVAIMPSGDEAVASGDGAVLAFIKGMLSGTPTVGGTIPTPNPRDGLVISNDGKVLLARGLDGLTVYSITQKPTTFTQTADFTSLGASGIADGREGMALTPVFPCDRAVVVRGNTVNLITGLTGSAPAVSPGTLTVSGVSTLLAVSISPDGKFAVIGTNSGIFLVSGVDTGSLALVTTTPFTPSYQGASASLNLATVETLGITLDGKYAAVCDSTNSALLVIPITTTGFSAPVGVLTGVTCPSNDQLVTH